MPGHFPLIPVSAFWFYKQLWSTKSVRMVEREKREEREVTEEREGGEEFTILTGFEKSKVNSF